MEITEHVLSSGMRLWRAQPDERVQRPLRGGAHPPSGRLNSSSQRGPCSVNCPARTAATG